MNIDLEGLDVREQLAHIDQMLADADRKRQEIKFAPWQVAFVGMTAGAALFAAGAATGGLFVKLLVS
jgi:ABC-type hemin transport system substrate-binding protein